MALISPFIKINQGGIPRLESTSVALSGNNVTYTFRFHPFFNLNYTGLVLFKLASYTAPSAAGIVSFTSNGDNTITVQNYAGTNLLSTNAKLVTGGIFLGFVENNTVRIITQL